MGAVLGIDASAATGMVIDGVPVEDNDAVFVVNKEADDCLVVDKGDSLRRLNRCSPKARNDIETNFKHYDYVMFKDKNIPQLMYYSGGLWTEDAQRKFSTVKKKSYQERYMFGLAYRGELMHALKHVNQILGGHITFISDDFKSFVGTSVGPACTHEKQLGHSGRCFIVGLDRFSN